MGTLKKRIAVTAIAGIALLAAGLAAVPPFARWWAGFYHRLKFKGRLPAPQNAEFPEITLDLIPGDPIRMTLNPDDGCLTPNLRTSKYWELNETRRFLQILGEGDTVVDVGANVGYYTLLAARRVGERGRVYSFEPDPASFAILERNVRINGISNAVLERKAVSDQRGILTLHLHPVNKGAHSIGRPEEPGESLRVEAVPLDEYFREGDRRIDFVKIDTQGAEVLILRGMKNLLGRNPQAALLVEFWPCGLKGLGFTGQDLLGILRDHDLRLFDMGLYPELVPVREEDLLSSHTVENELHCNLLAVKGLSERNRLTEALREKEKAFEADTDELERARRSWEEDLLGRIRESAALPPDLQSALAAPADRRTAAQRTLLRNRFRSTTPLLERERRELDLARKTLESFERAFLDRK